MAPSPPTPISHNSVIGVWTTAKAVKEHKVIRGGSDPRAFGPLVQVSLLAGLPADQRSGGAAIVQGSVQPH